MAATERRAKLEKKLKECTSICIPKRDNGSCPEESGPGFRKIVVDRSGWWSMVVVRRQAPNGTEAADFQLIRTHYIINAKILRSKLSWRPLSDGIPLFAKNGQSKGNVAV